MMDWFNTNFYRDFGYGWIYPQLFPHHRRPDDAVHSATIAWGKERAKSWLQVLNDHWLGDGRPYLCGEKITIADYFGASLLTLGEVIRCDFSAWPNVARWLGQHEAAAELAQGQRGALRLRRGGQGPEVRRRLTRRQAVAEPSHLRPHPRVRRPGACQGRRAPRRPGRSASGA